MPNRSPRANKGYSFIQPSKCQIILSWRRAYRVKIAINLVRGPINQAREAIYSNKMEIVIVKMPIITCKDRNITRKNLFIHDKARNIRCREAIHNMKDRSIQA